MNKPIPQRGRLSSCLGSALGLLLALVLLVIAVTLILVASFSARSGGLQQLADTSIQRLDAPASRESRPVSFSIQEGESAQAIAERLEEQGLIQQAWRFSLLAYYYQVQAELQAGDYELRPNMTTTEILGRIHRGLVRVSDVTLVEGWRREEIADHLGREGIFAPEDFLAALERPPAYDFLRSRPADASLEGYLFPDTYRLAPSAKPADLIDQMLQNFDRRFTPDLRQEAEAKGLTVHEVVTLASIVEREAALPAERPLIAAVFLNRLQIGMRLDADPTVQYALAGDPQHVARFGYWKQELTVADLALDSPYNTYRHVGLPPGPIASPGLASILAVVQPASTDYLYFMARGDGTHAFARTLDEHVENVRRFQP